jgi:NAD(P)-dependent dehydrogenase (short-subunit alcohol dehydrogenase family)
MAAAAPAAVCFVTGSSRGIGVEFIRQLLARGDSVLATCRTPAKAAELQEVLAAHASLGAPNFGVCLPLDVSSEESIAGIVAAVDGLSEEVPAIDCVIHNAGISAPSHPVDPASTANKTALMSCFETNAVGPLLLTQALLPKLRAGAGKKMFFVSSNMGSMENTADVGASGSSVSYRASKAALNMVGRCLAAEHGPLTPDGFAISLVHPGWVATDMGSAGARDPPVAPADSVAGMLRVLDSMGAHSNADFLDYTGATLPW